MKTRKNFNQRGFNLVELAIAIGIFAIMTTSVMVARTQIAKASVANIDKAYAAEKAIQMYQELQALVNGQEQAGVEVLDNYSDGTLFNTVLTTDKAVDTAPPGSGSAGNPLSGNKPANGHWRYVRQIEINKLATDPYSRQVVIKVWLYASDSNPTQPGLLLAEVGGILRTIANLFPPSQNLDIYVLGIQNISAWWVQLPVLFETFQNIVSDIQGRNPGLTIRPHYITRSSFGRDPQYVPYINESANTDSASSGGAIPWVYFYPGLSPQDAATLGCGCESDYYWGKTNQGVQIDGSFNVSGSVSTPSQSQFAGCPGYAAADRNNNSMRYPDELAMFQAVTELAGENGSLPANSPVTEITERMLLEGMLSTPQSFTNAMIVNLHGELLPMPPMRNYSDAAKDPGNLVANAMSPNGDTDVRVVTHPELIYYPGLTNSNSPNCDLKLRVYAYYDGMDDMTQLEATYPSDATHDPKVPAISLYFPDVTQGANTSILGVSACIGNSQHTYTWDAFPAMPTAGYYNPTVADVGPGTNPVSFGYQYVGPNHCLLMTLYNTRLRCPNFTDNTGLNANDQLYNCEYIPCSPDQTALVGGPSWSFTFGRDLTDTSAGPGKPKNTARWSISLQVPVTSVLANSDAYLGNAFNGPMTVYGQHAIETRIGNMVTASSSPNLSRTYVWTGGAFPPPMTERYQFLGDPRHCPYLDVKVGGTFLPPANAQAATIQANGYNWYFKNLNGTVDGYTGFGQAGNVGGWGGDKNEIDVPRFYSMFRNALLNCTAIWTTMNGYSYYYYGMGGEFGSDQPPYTNGVTFNKTPWQTTSTTTLTNVAEIINNQGTVNSMKVISSTSNLWYEKAWLGELYPDSQYSANSNWAANGNLWVAGAAADNNHFYRRDFSAVATGGNSLNGFGRSLTSRAGPPGCTSFYNGSSSSGGQMNHESYDGSANILSLAQTCYSIFGYPLVSTISNTNNRLRPWHLSDAQTTSEWNIAPYSTHTTLSIPAVGALSRLFYSSDAGSDWNSTGVVKMTQTVNGTAQYAYVVESGLAISANVGTNDLGKTALVCMLRTFLDGGNYALGAGHITQVPLVEIYAPLPAQYQQPASINFIVDGPVTTAVPLTITGFVTIAAGPTGNIWFRYPGMTSTMANFYTEEYPGYANLANSTYQETDAASNPLTLDMNLKYSKNSGSSWQFIQDNSGAVSGVFNSNYIISSASFPLTYTWNVANAGTFPQGDYWIMVEAYRRGYPLDYASHVFDLSITR